MYCGTHGAVKGWGIDYSQVAIRMANEVATSLNIRDEIKLRFLCQDVVAGIAMCPPDYFDRVFALSLVEHLADKALEGLFAHIRRVLRPEGLAVLFTHANLNYVLYGYPLVALFKRIFLGQDVPLSCWAALEAGGDINPLTPRHFKELLQDAGLTCKVWLHPRKQFDAISGWWQACGQIFLAVPPFKFVFAQQIWAIAARDEALLSGYCRGF